MIKLPEFKRPKHVFASAWIQHAPFAEWLIEQTRPKCIVELGVYLGYSYLAMCEQVKRLELLCHCFGVDTWAGDPMSGHYGEEVFQHVSKLNAEYPFSKLVRKSFDDAVSMFDDGHIDILHIDGFHAYEAVKHDFETWRPKLTKNAIVLFHDTEVMVPGFGVKRFWQEISRPKNSFSFPFCNGLGVLRLNESADGPLPELFECSAEERQRIVSGFGALGAQIK